VDAADQNEVRRTPQLQDNFGLARLTVSQQVKKSPKPKPNVRGELKVEREDLSDERIFSESMLFITIARLMQEVKLCCEEGKKATGALANTEAILVESLDKTTEVMDQAVAANDVKAIAAVNNAFKNISTALKSYTVFDASGLYQGILIHRGVEHQLSLAESFAGGQAANILERSDFPTGKYLNKKPSDWIDPLDFYAHGLESNGLLPSISENQRRSDKHLQYFFSHWTSSPYDDKYEFTADIPDMSRVRVIENFSAARELAKSGVSALKNTPTKSSPSATTKATPTKTPT